MSSREDVAVADNATTADMFAVSPKRYLILKLTDCGFITAHDRFGFIAISFYR